MVPQLPLSTPLLVIMKGATGLQSRCFSSLRLNTQPKLASLPHYPVLTIPPASSNETETTAIVSMRVLARLRKMLEFSPHEEGLAASSSDSRFSLKFIRNKGIGMVATTRISPGDSILSERPVLLLPSILPHALSEGLPHLIQEAWSRLSPTQRQRVESLQNALGSRSEGSVDPDTQSKIGLLNTNSLTARFPVATEDGEETYAGVFPSIARCNHSCSPNAIYHFNPESFRATLIATSPIEDGQEVTITYINPCLSQEVRRSTLLEVYAFECNCPKCMSSELVESNRRRAQLREFIDELVIPRRLVESGGGDGAVSYPSFALTHPDTEPSDLRWVVHCGDAIFGLVEEEGLSALVPEIHSAIERAAFASVLLGDKAGFEIWARQAQSYSRIARWMHGRKPLLTEDQWEQSFDQPRKFFATWGRKSES